MAAARWRSVDDLAKFLKTLRAKLKAGFPPEGT
jgi:hypothetical protein